MKKALLKISIVVTLLLAFSFSTFATNGMIIIVRGDRHTDYDPDFNIIIVTCVPSQAVCFSIVVEPEGTTIVWDNGGNNTVIEVEDDYISTTDSDGTQHYTFHEAD